MDTDSDKNQRVRHDPKAINELLGPESYFTKENNIFINDLNRICKEYDDTFKDVSFSLITFRRFEPRSTTLRR
jgi:hypothetical protein